MGQTDACGLPLNEDASTTRAAYEPRLEDLRHPRMSRLPERDETYFTTVRGMCRRCRSVAPARVFFRDAQVWQQCLCPCGPHEPALIAADSDWYLAETVRAMPDQSPLPGARPPQHGCPHDCGPCTWHASPCQRPTVSLTSACNLRCPICLAFNRQDRPYHMSLDELRNTVDGIIASCGRLDSLNITGGEPTLHPDLLAILRECCRPEIGRVTLSSNGVLLAEDRDLCGQLADLGVEVSLSFHTFDPEVSRRLHGCDLVAVKLQAIENLRLAGVRMSLLTVLVRGLNEGDLAGVLRFLCEQDNIPSLTVQTMAYTGQGGGQFPRARHIPVDEAARLVCQHSDGVLGPDDFVASPSAHSLCFLIGCLVKRGDRLLPLARFAPREQIRQWLQDSYQVQRPPLTEPSVRTVCVHAPMDEDTFDCSRAMLCPELVAAEPGRLMPACTHNLFHRMQDRR